MCRSLVGLLLAAVSPMFAASIWVESEDADASSVSGHPWYDSVKNGELSDNSWISHFSDKAPGQASYRIEVK
jgi:hypothetical protein